MNWCKPFVVPPLVPVLTFEPGNAVGQNGRPRFRSRIRRLCELNKVVKVVGGDADEIATRFDW